MDPELLPGSGIKVPDPDPAKSEKNINKTVNSGLFVPVWRIRIRGISVISLDPDPYKKMAGSGIRIRIQLKP